MEGTGDEVLLQTDFGLVDGRRHYFAMVAPERGSGGTRSELGLIGGQIRCFFPDIHSHVGIKC